MVVLQRDPRPTTPTASTTSTPSDAATWPAVLTVDQAAALVGIHEQTLRSWLRAGRLRGRRTGRRWHLLREELLEDLTRPAADVDVTTPRRTAAAVRATGDDGKVSVHVVAVIAGLALVVGLGGASLAPEVAGSPAAPPTAAGPWTRPVEAAVVSGFGQRCLGGRCRMHTGADLGAATGTPVVAASAGVVADARCTSDYCDRPGRLGLGGSGNLVTITHPAGVTTRYAHLVRFTVAPGQQVTAGQVIGQAGSTGNSTGPHLHFEVKTSGAFIDPVPFMAAHGAPLDAREVPA